MTQHAKWLALARTVRGQIVLMAICYGVFALASCLVVSFRAEWIEPSVREIFPAEAKLPRVKEQQELARRIAEGDAKPARLADLSAADLLTIYGVAVDEEDVDTNHLLTDALWQEQPEEMILRIERTIVAATTVSGGRVRVIEECENCSYHKNYTYSTPRLPKPVKRKGGSRSFGGGGGRSSGFGGGRSSGRGASGRW